MASSCSGRSRVILFAILLYSCAALVSNWRRRTLVHQGFELLRRTLASTQADAITNLLVPDAMLGQEFLSQPLRGGEHTYLVYSHPTLGYRAVKDGFSWPAFFFTWIWAFFHKLWRPGFFLLVLFLLGPAAVIAVIVFLFGVAPPAPRFLTCLLEAVLGVVVGLRGNRWLRQLLSESGYEYVDTSIAANPEGAVALIAKGGGRRESRHALAGASVATTRRAAEPTGWSGRLTPFAQPNRR